MTAYSASDTRWMNLAIALAERQLGRIWPNPAVGCVIVSEDRLIARGWTQNGGRPHAETEALARAGIAARGSTMYVSLEPCAHYGVTPPCIDAIVRAGVVRVVAAMLDPDPRVNGCGIAALTAAGVNADVGLMGARAASVNLGFCRRILESRPLVTLKLGTSLDGRIATSSGESRWITGEMARAWVHGLRASHDAIMIGSGTVIADDPELTCRLPGMRKNSPGRVIMDGRLRTSPSSRLFRDNFPPTWTWIVTAPGMASSPAGCALVRAGAEILESPVDESGRLLPRYALSALARRGVTRVLVEGGGSLSASLMEAEVVDEVEWIHAGCIIGAGGIPAVGPLHTMKLDEVRRLHLTRVRRAGDDAWATWVYRRRASTEISCTEMS